MTGPLLLFGLLAAVAIVCGILMVAQDNPVRSALFLVLVLFSVALLYLTLNAAFIAAVQIIVYAGAIMVLFIFVIMLLNMGAPRQDADPIQGQKMVAPVVGLFLAAVFFTVILAIPHTAAPRLSTGLTGANEVGLVLFDPGNYWLFPFEVVSILLLVAAVGAVILAKKRI
ncbi:MAG: NADH-quinone oxidoreductase subunit J [Capsulimonadaceae bacterium]